MLILKELSVLKLSKLFHSKALELCKADVGTRERRQLKVTQRKRASPPLEF